MADAKTLETTHFKERFEYIPTDKIILDPKTEFNSEIVKQLEESMEATGLVDPIKVRPANDHYELMDGRHRTKAALNIHMARLPAFIKDMTDEEVEEQSLITNIVRRKMSGPEIGQKVRGLLRDYPLRYKKQKDLAKRIGLTEERLSSYIQLTLLPEEVQKLIAPENESRRIPEGRIDDQVGYEIVRDIKDDDERQIEVAQALAKHGITGHRGKRLVKKVATEEYKYTPIEKVIEDVQLEEKYERERPVKIELNETEAKAYKEGKKTTVITRTNVAKPGTEVELWAPIGKVKVEMVYLRTLRNMKVKDSQNEGYNNLEELKEGWIEKHGTFDENEKGHINVFERKD